MIPDSRGRVKRRTAKVRGNRRDRLGDHMQVVVLGSGSWGTALALILARNGADVQLVGRAEEDVASMRLCRENLRYLPGFVLPKEVTYGLYEEASTEADLWVIAVPSAGVRRVCSTVRGQKPLVCLASKGLEPGSATLLGDVVAEECPGADLVVLGGPNLAVELVRGVPSVAVVAGKDQGAAERVRSAFFNRSFRVYLHDDATGVQLAGALKNVLAIGAGLSDGLGFGDNTKGALMARGLAEMCRLGAALGAQAHTFYGIAGVGDLLATAVSKLSRNYRVGLALGEGRTLENVLNELGQVAEGVPTSEGAVRLARQANVQLPIFEAIDAVLRRRVSPRDAVTQLMERLPTSEMVLP